MNSSRGRASSRAASPRRAASASVCRAPSRNGGGSKKRFHSFRRNNRMPISLRFALAAAWMVFCRCVCAEIVLTDDRGQSVTLKQPAARIISTAPHITELLFAVGAGDRIVGVTDYSNYPEAASRIQRIGSNMQLDMERIVGLQPDLIVAWLHGSAQRQLERVAQFGIPVFYNEPRRLRDI